MISIVKKIQSSTNLSEQEAWWMLEKITKKSKAKLLFLSKEHLSKHQTAMINEWVVKLSKKNIPLTYLLGSIPFLNLTIQVEAPILIPRPETEEWVNMLINELQSYQTSITNILDIGTGTGCIAIALAKAFSKAQVTAIDINPKAIELATKNATLNKVSNISFIESNLFNNIPANKSFDLIVSNPPYIDPTDKDHMLKQVTKWEDPAALFAENKGLGIIEQIFAQSKNYLSNKRNLPYQLVFEFGYNQGTIIPAIAQKQDWTCSIEKDAFNNNRTAWCSKN